MTRRTEYKKLLTMLFCAALLVIVAWTAVGITANAAKHVKHKKPKEPTITAAVQDNKQYGLTNDMIKKWLKKYSIGKVEWWGLMQENSYPKTVKLSWKTKRVKKGSKYVVLLSTDPEMKKAKKYSADGKSIELDNLMTGTQYYWQVYVKGNKKIISPVNKFRTKKGFRTLRVPGVSNFRDFGGKKVKGGVIKQGLIYRSAKMENITQEGRKIALKDLKIKTEFDLRKPGTVFGEEATMKRSPIGNKVRYVNLSGTYYIWLWRSEWDKKVITQEIKVLANKNNYPIVFHCAIGRDRTGTLSFILGGLLGVPVKQLFQDYEMSYFSLDGCMARNRRTELTYRARFAYNQISKYGSEKDPFSKKVELFLRDMGVTKRDINRLKTNLIEKKDEADR